MTQSPPQKLKATSSPRQAYVTLGLVLGTSLMFGLLVLPRIGPREGRTGALAPEFSLPIVAGGDANDRVSLLAQRGKVTVLDFWATWCGPCVEQAKVLERYVALARPDVLILGVNEGEPVAVLRPYFEQHRVSYPVVADLDESVGQSFSVSGLPTLVVVDKTGKIASVTSGVVPYARLERLVADAASGR
jgi:thiol-disulfide isomerase/thioredoxin